MFAVPDLARGRVYSRSVEVQVQYTTSRRDRAYIRRATDTARHFHGTELSRTRRRPVVTPVGWSRSRRYRGSTRPRRPPILAYADRVHALHRGSVHGDIDYERDRVHGNMAWKEYTAYLPLRTASFVVFGLARPLDAVHPIQGTGRHGKYASTGGGSHQVLRCGCQGSRWP